MADFLVLQDLYNRATQEKIDGFFDDSYNGVLTEETGIVDDVLMAAEGEYYSRVLRAYPDTTKATMILLVNNDPVLKQHVSWIACELASERRSEFLDSDGWGCFKAQYERAVKHIDRLSKGQLRSVGEQVAGQGANTGGKLQPKPPAATEKQFVFAPSKDAPTGHGGF